MLLFCDTEAYSEIDIKARGAAFYAAHASTECTIFTYALENETVKCWDITHNPLMPIDLKQYLIDEEITLVFHNVPFDRAILKHCLGFDIPITRFLDNAVKALMLGLPASLGQLGEALGLPEEQAKLKDGRRLIAKFCKPRKVSKNNAEPRWNSENAPEDWEKFKEYAIQDVTAMRILWHKMPNFNYKGSELALWYLDQTINERGLPLDIEALEAAQVLITEELKIFDDRVYALTDGFISSANQRNKVLQWIKLQGVTLTGLTKVDVSEALETNLSVKVRDLLEIRQESSKTSTAKIKKMLACACKDGRVRGTLQFYGASRTGRWAGRLIQIQNFSRGNLKDVETAISTILTGITPIMYDSVMDTISSCLRGFIAAPKGKKFVVSDLAGIEARVLPFLAHDEAILDIFRNGDDIYKYAASGIYNVSIADVTKDQRFIGKIAVLALGYQGGKNAFLSMAKVYGIDLPEDKAQSIVNDWRSSNKKIMTLWKDVAVAARNAINTGKTQTVKSLKFRVQDKYLLIKLPSGRCLSYPQPNVSNEKITFMGVDQYSRKWKRQDTYGGKLVENITQAVARDILAANMPIIEAKGYQIIASVHDELICEVADTETHTPEELEKLMCIVPEWAEGLPLDAEGEKMYRYKK